MWTIKTPPDPLGQGNDLYREWQDPATGITLRLTFWDLWLVMYLVKDFNANWDEMVGFYQHRAQAGSFHRENAEGLLNHLRHLKTALEQTGLTAQDVLEDTEKGFITRQRPKAKRRILDLNISNGEKSRWMMETPRYLLAERALRGHWAHFPVSPERFTRLLSRLFIPSGGYFNESQSFDLAQELSDFLERQTAQANPEEVVALYRAFLTVTLDKMNFIDDSGGVIGDLYEDVFRAYFQLERASLPMDPTIFFQDLMELLIWEDYGFTDRASPDLFASLAPAEVAIVEPILIQARQELASAEITYQAEQALTFLGMLYATQQMFDRFVPAAREMGTREWRRITRLAEAAEENQRPDLAIQVYEACLGPGSQERFLRQKYEELRSRLNF